jgi:hypothetical protein
MLIMVHISEKGYNFLYYLEQLLGGPSVFEPVSNFSPMKLQRI